MTPDLLDRSTEKIRRLAQESLDVASFWSECGAVIGEVVPHFYAPCWFTFDPASLLVTSHFDPAMPEVSGDFLAHEYTREDPWKMAAVARSPHATMTVHEATNGSPETSECWRKYVAAYGAEQELMVPLRDRRRNAWATLSLYREAGAPMFSEHERTFLASIAGSLADGARRGMLIGDASIEGDPLAPCLVVVGEDWSVESMTPGSDEVMARLPGGPHGLPTAVRSVAASVLSSDELTEARVRDESGHWLTLHGAPMHGQIGRAAVIIEQTDPDRLAPLLMDAYGLTEREKTITHLVLQGLSTAEIASTELIASQTVQQHLKHIFEKTGVNSRRELVGKIFFTHFEPRLRDNERRAQRLLPMRGGPIR